MIQRFTGSYLGAAFVTLIAAVCFVNAPPNPQAEVATGLGRLVDGEGGLELMSGPRLF